MAKDKGPSLLQQIYVAESEAEVTRLLEKGKTFTARPKTIRMWERAAKARRAQITEVSQRAVGQVIEDSKKDWPADAPPPGEAVNPA